MANKTQAKAAVTAAALEINNNIDTILPAGVNISDGHLSFGPTKWAIVMSVDTGGDADILEAAISTNLSAIGTIFTVSKQRRRGQGARATEIHVGNDSYRILYP